MDYWRAVYYPLQDAGLNLMLVNPAHLRGIRGRKTDPSDAAFLARAAASGMVLASFVPDREVRELRELTRRRTEIRADRGREMQRLEKELEDSGIKLTSVLSDVTGVSSRRILAALIDGERDPARLAELTVSGARAKIGALIEALDGTFTDHHAFMCRHFLNQIDHLAALVTELDERIAELLRDRDRDRDLGNLDSIPGIGRTAAEIIISETGGDMARFATAVRVTQPDVELVAGKGLWWWASDLLPAHLEALVAVDDVDRVRLLVTRFADGLHGRDVPAAAAAFATCDAILAAGAGDPANAAELFVDAALKWAKLKRPYAELLAVEQLGRCLLITGDYPAGTAKLARVQHGCADSGRDGMSSASADCCASTTWRSLSAANAFDFVRRARGWR